MNGVIIREAIPSDAMGIAIVQAYTWLTTYSGLMPDEILQARIDRVPSQAEHISDRICQGDAYAVAECGGAIVGFVCGSSSRNESYPDDGEIQGLYVLKGFHGRHIGKNLFENCAQKLRRSGCDHLIVNCLKGNSSMGFYQRMGGQVVGERTDAIRGYEICENIFRFDI